MVLTVNEYIKNMEKIHWACMVAVTTAIYQLIWYGRKDWLALTGYDKPFTILNQPSFFCVHGIANVLRLTFSLVEHILLVLFFPSSVTFYEKHKHVNIKQVNVNKQVNRMTAVCVMLRTVVRSQQ